MLHFVAYFTWWVKDEKKREWLNQFLGFAVVGVTMTLLSVLLFFICFDIYDLPLEITYASVSIFTILLSYLLNNFLVFKKDFSFKKMVLYYGVYLSGMLIGIVLLYYMKKCMPFSKTVLSTITIPIIMVWNFMLSSTVLKSERL